MVTRSNRVRWFTISGLDTSSWAGQRCGYNVDHVLFACKYSGVSLKNPG